MKSQTTKIKLPFRRSPSSDPEKYVSIILKARNIHFPHLIIRHRPIGQFHVNIPRWIRHYYCKLSQNCHVKLPDITSDPLEVEKLVIIL